MSKVYTNKIIYKINKKELKDKYDIIKIDFSFKPKEYPKIWELFKKEESFLVYKKDGKYLYVLTKIGQFHNLDLTAFAEAGVTLQLVDHISIERIKDYVLLNLIIGLQAVKTKIGAGLIADEYFQSGFYIINKTMKSKLIALKISIDNNYFLNLDVVTFSLVKPNKQMVKKHLYRKKEGKLVLVNKIDTSKKYYTKKATNKKSKISFMKFDKDFINSKVGHLAVFMEEIGKDMKNLLQIELESDEFCIFKDGLDIKKKKDETKFNLMQAFSEVKEIFFYDMENYLELDKQEKITNNIKKFLDYSVEVKFINQIVDQPTIVLIDPKDSYVANDPYNEIKNKGKLTQVITTENIDKMIEINFDRLGELAFLEAILKELLIKIEIQKGEFWLHKKWTNFIDDIYFIPYGDGGFKKLCISQNTIKLEQISIKDLNNIEDLKSLDKNEISNNDIEFICFKKNGTNYMVVKSNEFVLQDINELLTCYRELKRDFRAGISKSINLRRKNIKTKGKNYKEKSYEALTGIRYKKENHMLKYYSSLNDATNPGISVLNATKIRKVYFNGEFDEISFLDTLDEYFVNNRRLTVLPIVVKYLREFCQLN